MTSSTLSRSAVLLAPFGLALALAAPASAHVTVQPGTAEQGGYTAIAFRVPNELDDATTTKIQVKFPTDHPFASVSTTPVAGWTVDVQKMTLATPLKSDDGDVTEAVSTITWTATGTGIATDQYQDFDVSVGPVPDSVSSLGFPAVQTYSDGTVVSWIDPVVDGQPEPEHPTPTLHLVKGTDDDAEPSSAASASAAPSAAAPSVTASTAPGASNVGYVAGTEKDTTARTLGVVGIVVGALGIGTGALLGRRRQA